ncbi:MAG: hypothetical protein ACQCN6_04985 [Candidatus Bathyarchaeia archaeon]|jgi:hypothetical protein
MGKTSKTFALLLTITIVMACLTTLTVKPANAQSIPKPSVPEFTIKYNDYSYNVPPVYGIDPDTDENVTKVEGYHVDNRTVEFTIINQPFTPFIDPSNGRTINLFYNIKYKLSSGGEWVSMFGGDREFWAGSSGQNFDPYVKFGYPIEDYSSQYTIIKYAFLSDIPSYGAIDFQVQALEGYTNYTAIGESHIFYSAGHYTFYGEKSGWSSTQKISLSDGKISTVDSSFPSPTVPELSWLTIAPLLLSMFSIALVFRRRKIGVEAIGKTSNGKN